MYIKIHQNLRTVLKKFGDNKQQPPTFRVLTTYPRSGTHWLKRMLSNVMSVSPLERQLLEPSVLISVLNSETSRHLVYEHFDYDLHGSILDPNVYRNLRIVLLFRDPRDALISNFYRRAWLNQLPNSKLDPLANLRLFLRGYFYDNHKVPVSVQDSRLFSMAYRDYVRRCAVDWIRAGQVFPLRYEDLIADTSQYLAYALDYLNIQYSPKIMAKAVTDNRFEVLSEGRIPGEVMVESHYRRGLPGEWRGLFDQEDLEIVNDLIGDYLELLGYPLQ